MINIPNRNLEIIAFDVQNADAFLIKTPKNKYFMIDTGKAPYNGGKSQAEIIITKYMKDRGIKNIEGIIITHFDNDHSGGAVDIINKVHTNKVYINSFTNSSFTSKNIYKTLKEKHVSAQLAKNNGIIYEEGDLKITTYCPTGKSDNEQSIITLVSYKDFDALFMGDAGIEAYNNIQKYIPTKPIEVFKVGHHGARGVVDNKMVENLKPQISILSTGKNTFGHPTKVTLDTLRNTDIYRTDYNNSLKISTNKTSYKVLSYDPKLHKYVPVKTYQNR
jgi:competence protein ComEC